MKNIITKALIALMLAITGVAKAQQWTEIHTGVSEDLYDICCVDSSNVLACGPNGLIIKTTDGGQIWNRKNSNTESSLYLLKFANENIGFACGDGVFLKTTDGGENWQELYCDTIVCFDYYWVGIDAQTNLFLVDADTLYVADCMNCLWKSIDGGENFEKILDLQYTVDEFYKFDMFFEDNFGYLIGYGDFGVFHSYLTVFKTMDYGNTWETIEFPEIDGYLSGVHFLNKDHIRIHGSFGIEPTSLNDYYGVLETTDGLVSYSLGGEELWEAFPDPFFGESLAFSSENKGCYVYNVVTWKDTTKDLSDFWCVALLTQDNGDTWQHVPDGINWRNQLYSVDAVDTVFYISASYGYVYKTGVAGIIYPWTLAESASTIEVFPNPTSDKVFVNIEPAVEPETSSPVHVELTGADGRIVMQRTLLGNNVTLDMDNLSPGIYVLSVKGNSFLHRQTVIKTE